MSQPERVDTLILGSGEGGKFLAWDMAKSGHRTALVERKLIGGSCPNTNCLPSKNEIWSAKVADLLRHADRFGAVTGAVAIDMKKVLARKRAMVDGLIAMHLDYYKASGAELIMGTGRFIAPKTIEVQSERRRVARPDRRSRGPQSWDACADSRHPGPGGGKAAQQCRAARARSPARPPDYPGRRICRPGNGASLSPLRQPGHDHRGGTAARRPGRSRRRGRHFGDAARGRHRAASRRAGARCAGSVRRSRQPPAAHHVRRSDRCRQRHPRRGRTRAQHSRHRARSRRRRTRRPRLYRRQ